MPRSDEELPFICERCGYALEGLDAASVCPECGMAIGESLPSRRVVSAWQRKLAVKPKGSFRSLIRTWFDTVAHPVRTMRGLAITREWKGLAFLNLLTASFLAGISVSGSSEWMEWLAFAHLVVVGPILLLATWIECVGIRAFGRRRGWRLVKLPAWQVCAHASVGWVVGFAPLGVLALALYGYSRLSGEPPVRFPVVWVMLSALAAMLAFETLVYIGARQCRYANTPGAGPKGDVAAINAESLGADAPTL